MHYGLDYAVYRTLPTHCHSELCAMVIDATGDTTATLQPLRSTESNSTESAPEDVSSVIVSPPGSAESASERESVPSKCQQGWRYISTLTRVMPVRYEEIVTCTYTVAYAVTSQSPSQSPSQPPSQPPTQPPAQLHCTPDRNFNRIQQLNHSFHNTFFSVPTLLSSFPLISTEPSVTHPSASCLCLS